jgi:hypothetical protein
MQCETGWSANDRPKAFFYRVREVHDESELVSSLEAIRLEHPDAYEACHLLLRKYQLPNRLAR